MDLCEVIDGIDVVRLSGRADPQVLSVAYDSRKVTPGALFFALPGEKANGAQFAGDAIARGAIAVASSQARPAGIPKDVTWVQVADGEGTAGAGDGGRKFLRAARQFFEACGGYRNERKNDHSVSGRFDPAVRGIYHGAGGHHRLSHPGGRPVWREHHARIARSAPDVRGGTRRGRHARGAGDQFSRARHGPAVGLPFRGGDFHESDARSSRLPQDV